jgi:polysaccharide export outer membrane protein
MSLPAAFAARIAALWTLGAAALGCGGTGSYVWVQELPIEPPAARADERIGKGDVVAVRVFGQDVMSSHGKVRPNGTFAMPILGDIPVEGKQPMELAKELDARLKAYVVTPLVTVAIEESAPIKVTVIGEVRKTGTLNLESPLGLVHALADAGGLTEYASETGIYVVRSTPSGAPLRVRFNYRELLRGEPHASSFRLQNRDLIEVE